MITIRRESAEDLTAIRMVNERAFGQPEEADIVDKLRHQCGSLLSLVATTDNQIVGHILFTPVMIDNRGEAIQGMGLAPMAVLPEYQRRGIGSKLIESGLAILRELSCPFVIVLGHPQYYRRFGFVPASKYAVRCQWGGVPQDALMILVLNESVMNDVSGTARYRSEFDEAFGPP